MDTLSRKRIALFLLLVCFMVTSCRQTKGGEDRYVHGKVEAWEFAGVWDVSEKILRFVRDDDLEDSAFLNKCQQLNLHEDGSCDVEIYRRIPSLPSNIDENQDYIYINASYECRWQLTKARAYIGHKEVMVPVVEIIAMKEIYRNEVLEKTSSSTVRLYITEEKGELILWDFIGDPDYRHYREFKKRQDEAVIVPWLQEYGGYCDCEVLANVEERWGDFVEEG